MDNLNKGKSPFYPGQPVPIDFFVGRSQQIDRIMTRGVGQASAGRPGAIFTQGEYGIGKSSIAGFVQRLAEEKYGLHAIYVSLGGCRNLEEVAVDVMKATIRSGAFDPTKSARIREWLARYVGEQAILGLNFNFSALADDAPALASAHGMLDFLNQTYERLKDTGIRGIFLVLDEINGIAAAANFSDLVKGLVDTNALSRTPLPLLLMICGVEEKRREMIDKHPPVDRIFDVVDIDKLSENEMREFFNRAFQSANISVESEAMDYLTHYSAGFPKIMHLIGDAAYWLDNDNRIDNDDAIASVITAAKEVGRKYVDQQVFRALRSDSYLAILEQIASMGLADMAFTKKEVTASLSQTDLKRFDNFIQRMKKLKVIKSGDVQGEYTFISRMVRLYIGLYPSTRKSKEQR